MKIAAFDIGDAWTGIALSDPMGIIAKPYKTIVAKELLSFIPELLKAEPVSTIVIGYPKTMRGTESAQTKKIVELKEQLQKQFQEITWILWDERLSSKRASSLKQTRTKEDKIKSHAIAAAYILESYLMYRNMAQESV